MDCEPSFDYHRASANWEYSASGYGEAVARANHDPDAHPTLRLTTNLRIGLESRQARRNLKSALIEKYVSDLEELGVL
jgi:hypothetical protein